MLLAIFLNYSWQLWTTVPGRMYGRNRIVALLEVGLYASIHCQRTEKKLIKGSTYQISKYLEFHSTRVYCIKVLNIFQKNLLRILQLLLLYLSILLAPRSSTLIQVLKNRTVFRTLTEKILLLLNRESKS